MIFKGKLVNSSGNLQFKDAYIVGLIPENFSGLLPDYVEYGLTFTNDNSAGIYNNSAVIGNAGWTLNHYFVYGPHETHQTLCASSGGGYTLGQNGLTFTGPSVCRPQRTAL